MERNEHVVESAAEDEFYCAPGLVGEETAMDDFFLGKGMLAGVVIAVCAIVALVALCASGGMLA